MNSQKLNFFSKTVKVIAIVCLQWGDSGKGKFSNAFARFADIVARGTGGDNAGHTVYENGKKYVFHSLPSGILHPKVINIIGSGTVNNPRTLFLEISKLENNQAILNNLMVSLNAKMIMPFHVIMDRMKEAQSFGHGKIGTTGKGIGPCYLDHYDRCGLIMNDLLNPVVFAKKLKDSWERKKSLFASYDQDLLREVISAPDLESSYYYHPEKIIDLDKIMEKYLEYGRFLSRFIKDTDSFMRKSVQSGKKILLEGAQGVLLSIDHGTYPYVTCSDPTVDGLAKGVGLSRLDVDLEIGIIKGYYTTRVGAGPFPEELGGVDSDFWCNGEGTREKEETMYENLSINSSDALEQGVAIRRIGDEYGSTTKRPRRVGWLSLPLLKYSLKTLARPNVIMTKLDVLNDCDEIEICTHYIYTGPTYNYGGYYIQTGSQVYGAIPNSEFLKYCKPVFKKFKGWKSDISRINDFDSLPKNFKTILKFIEEETGINPIIISVGVHNEDIILHKKPLSN